MTEDDIHEIRNKALFSERMVIDYLLPFRDEAEDLRQQLQVAERERSDAVKASMRDMQRNAKLVEALESIAYCRGFENVAGECTPDIQEWIEAAVEDAQAALSDNGGE